MSWSTTLQWVEWPLCGGLGWSVSLSLALCNLEVDGRNPAILENYKFGLFYGRRHFPRFLICLKHGSLGDSQSRSCSHGGVTSRRLRPCFIQSMGGGSKEPKEEKSFVGGCKTKKAREKQALCSDQNKHRFGVHSLAWNKRRGGMSDYYQVCWATNLWRSSSKNLTGKKYSTTNPERTSM